MDNKEAVKIIENKLDLPLFRLANDEERKYGTSLQGYIVTTFSDLKEAFGEPEESDGYKISGQWVFKDQFGNEYTIYDWKSTNLYDSYLPAVEEFRRDKNSTEFNIGGFTNGNTEEFLNFLQEKVKGSKVRKR